MCMHSQSNLCYGEGGAGTWSDGKLTTRIGKNSDEVRRVLETLVTHGAPDRILVDGKPHLGTDRLVRILKVTPVLTVKRWGLKSQYYTVCQRLPGEQRSHVFLRQHRAGSGRGEGRPHISIRGSRRTEGDRNRPGRWQDPASRRGGAGSGPLSEIALREVAAPRGGPAAEAHRLGVCVLCDGATIDSQCDTYSGWVSSGAPARANQPHPVRSFRRIVRARKRKSSGASVVDNSSRAT